MAPTLEDEWHSFVAAAVQVAIRETRVIEEFRKVFMAGVIVGADHMRRAVMSSDRSKGVALMNELHAYHQEHSR